MAGDTAEDPAHSPEHPVVGRLSRDVALGAGTRQGAKWIGGSRVGTQAFQFIATLITARLLLPSQFGEAAIALALATFAQLFTDLGLSAAVIHAKRATADLLATAFWLNVATGFALTLLVSSLAYPLALLYDQPSLVPLLTVVSLNFIFSAGAVQTALLERTLHFKRLAVLETAASIVGSALTPILAIGGVGTISLVLGYVAGTLVRTILLWSSVPWRVDRRPSRAALATLWRFSRGLVGFNVLNYWSRNLDTLLLGGFASSSALGAYTRAFSLTMVPVQQMSVVLGRVMYPALARMQDQPARMGVAWLRGVKAAGNLTLPATVTLAATAPALVAVLFGPGWELMVPLLQLLALSTMPQIIAGATGSLYRATGATDLLFKLGLVNTILGVLAIIAGLPWGTYGVALALLIRSWIALPLVLLPLGRLADLSQRRILRAFAVLALPLAALAAGEIGAGLLFSDAAAPLPVLLAQVGAGTALFVPVLLWTSRETRDAVRRRLRRSTRTSMKDQPGSVDAPNPSSPIEPPPVPLTRTDL